ncbi:MAG: class I SAM-dependent methyltransferase [Methylococcales bacterium]|jgi:SAM-dependent methyltransferase|nr:class I SAM-dependent methyltransferase [Methylococcales bacterium]
MKKNQTIKPKQWIKESSFGTWFLDTEIWLNYVLKIGIDDLESLLSPYRQNYPIIADIGCGSGKSIKLMDERFHPEQIIGIDIDPNTLNQAQSVADSCHCSVNLLNNSAAKIELESNSVDMILCHQTMHHISDPDTAIKELFRILKPSGILLLSESCRQFIHSFLVKVFFRHPMNVQKTADEYIEFIMQAGFEILPNAISKPNLWWSRWDLGTLEFFGRPLPKKPEPTIINLVAKKVAMNTQ